MTAIRYLAPLVLVCMFLRAALAQSDAEPVLTAMRAAMGGDAALSAVASFLLKAEGKRQANVGPTRDLEIEIASQFPDRYVRVTESRNGTKSFEGFSVDAPIQRSRDRQGRSALHFSTAASPQEVEEARRRAALAYQHEFARLVTALFGRSFTGYPLEFSHLGQEESGGMKVDAIEARGRDAFSFRLYVDASTHLPVAVHWKAIPTFTATTGQISLRVGPVEPVDHAMTFADFRPIGAIKWPHRIREFVGTRFVQDTEIKKISVNPTLDPQLFSIGR